MLGTIGMSLLLAAAPIAVDEEVRTLRVSVVDAKGRPVRDLEAHEVAVIENGVARRVTRIAEDSRPLTVALLVDSSAAVADQFRLDLVPALATFLRRLPDGTRVGLWTSGTRPTRAVDWTTETPAVEKALERVMLGGGNTLIDAIDEVLETLVAAEGQRAALVIVTGNGIEFSSRDRPLAVEQEKRRAGIEVDAVQIDVVSQLLEAPDRADDEAPGERQARYERALAPLTSETGGRHEHVLSSTAVAGALARIAVDLSQGYVLTYASVPGLRTRKTEVLVSRPKVSIRHAPASPVN
jgi:VWFA-related protein